MRNLIFSLQKSGFFLPLTYMHQYKEPSQMNILHFGLIYSPFQAFLNIPNGGDHIYTRFPQKVIFSPLTYTHTYRLEGNLISN